MDYVQKDKKKDEEVILTQREVTDEAMTKADNKTIERTEFFDKAAEEAKLQRRKAAEKKQEAAADKKAADEAAAKASRIADEAAAEASRIADEEAAAAVLTYFGEKNVHQIFDELTRHKTEPIKPMSPGLQKALFSDLNSNYNTYTNFVKKLFHSDDESSQRTLSIQPELNDRLINVRKIVQGNPLNEEDHLKFTMIMMLLKNEKELLMDEYLTMTDLDIELLKEKIGYKHCEGNQCNVSGGYQKMRKSKTAKKQKKSTTAKKQKKRKTSTAKKQKKNRKSKTSKR